jgi:hypothetical protein
MNALTSAPDILLTAAECGLTLTLAGDRLTMKAAKEPPAELLAAIKGRKPEILAALASAEPFDPIALAVLSPADLVARLELAYGGRITLEPDGLHWRKRLAELPPEVTRLLQARRPAIHTLLTERAAHAGKRHRENSAWSADDWLAFYGERAAIREYDGTLSRSEAERLAIEDCEAHWLALNCPAPGISENGCWQCGGLGTDADGPDPLANRVCRGGVFWIHPRCWAAYDAESKAAAVAALRKALAAEYRSAGR